MRIDALDPGGGVHPADEPDSGVTGGSHGVLRKHVNDLCNDRRSITAANALILARVFGNRAEVRLNVQRHRDLWEILLSPLERERIERARPLETAA